MLNFTVGPVQSYDETKEIGGYDTPYFRTNEFSDIMLENERLLLEFSKASEDSKVVFITGSGTASMEASVMNTLTPEDKVLVVNGGSFGQRFVEILKIHDVPYSEIKVPNGKNVNNDMLSSYDKQGYTAFVVNIHETSTGVLYDAELISEFCKRNGLFLIVDAISSFLADELDMEKLGIDVMISGSQKALACPPGVSLVVLSKNALDRIEKSNVKCMYFDFKAALCDAKRGQTPFTPAVGILLQINARLKQIKADGGVACEMKKISKNAKYFREKIKGFPFEITSESMSNAVTSLHPTTASAYDIFTILKDEYGIWICPNGGEMRDTVFRVGHIGNLSVEDYDKLFAAFADMKKRGLL